MSDDDVDELGSQLGSDWKKLGRRLKIKEGVLSDLELNTQLYPDLSEKACAMLKKWRKTEGKSATYKVLYQALCHKHVERKDLAEEICCH